MKLEKGKYLITTDNWFYAPDGQSYKAVWGEVRILEDTVLGIKTNRNSSNWYAYVGSDEKGMVVAGCQIHYAVKSANKPSQDSFISEGYHEGQAVHSKVQTRIYIAE